MSEVGKSRYAEMVSKAQQSDDVRLITKLLEAKVEDIKDQFLLEAAGTLPALQKSAHMIESMIIDLNVMPVEVDDE